MAESGPERISGLVGCGGECYRRARQLPEYLNALDSDPVVLRLDIVRFWRGNVFGVPVGAAPCRRELSG